MNCVQGVKTLHQAAVLHILAVFSDGEWIIIMISDVLVYVTGNLLGETCHRVVYHWDGYKIKHRNIKMVTKQTNNSNSVFTGHRPRSNTASSTRA